MRSKIILAIALAAMTGIASGQQANTNFASYMVDAAAATGVGLSSPINTTTMTDTPITMNIQAFPNGNGFPVVMLFDFATSLNNTIIVNAWSNYNFKIDLRDRNANGYAGDQILFDGFTQPSSSTWTGISGTLSSTVSLPACTLQNNSLNCITASNADQFEVSTQALVYDVTNAPFGIRSTAATKGTFDNGYKQFTLTFDASGQFVFKQGFSFKFYGVTYTNANLSANGFVSFGATDTSFPNPLVSTIRSGVPRIMSFYNDLEPQLGNYATRIYALQFTDANGLRKVKFVHDRIAEYSDLTGPHGGECVITDNDDIAVYVHAYQTLPSINTAVGITPGGNVGPTISGFGVDLSAKSGTNFTMLAGQHGFELFDHYFTVANNSMDLIGFNFNLADPVGPGIVFLKNTALSNTTPSNSGYIIQ